MAKARKCDRCKQYYDKDEHSVNGLLVGGFELSPSEPSGRILRVDLCPDCMLKLIDFVEFPDLVLCRPKYAPKVASAPLLSVIIGYEEVRHDEKNETNT